ncbi:MAG: M15 family metallopeptidase [Cryobacterium sp.]|nr:M15 family metallopeptidase [Cryobacterium sp.]
MTPPRSTRTSRVVAFTALGVVAVAVIAAMVVATVQFVEWRQALTRYESAALAQDEAVVGFMQAVGEIDAAREELLDIDSLVHSILELEDDLVPREATAALSSLRDNTTVILAPLVTLGSPEVTERPAEPTTLDVEALDRIANRIAYESKRIDGATANRIRSAESVRGFVAEAGTALRDLVAGIVTRGHEFVTERQDASEKSLLAFQSALDTLAETNAGELLEALDVVFDAAGQVAHSSNAVRLSDPNSVVVVVNKRRPLQPQSYAPELVRVNVPYVSTPLLRQEAAGPLVEMFAAFHAETGEQLRLQNSYRSYATQTNTYNYHVSTKGQAQADRGSARPGHSEHQTGLALDVDPVGGGCSIQQCFGDMVHGKWLEANAWRFGWIIRYPNGYEHITGYDWEPWHLRYVGVDVSTAMHSRGIATLEEYFGLDPAPTY